MWLSPLVKLDLGTSVGQRRALAILAGAAEWQLEANASIPLCMETLFDDLGRLMRVA